MGLTGQDRSLEIKSEKKIKGEEKKGYRELTVPHSPALGALKEQPSQPLKLGQLGAERSGRM